MRRRTSGVVPRENDESEKDSTRNKSISSTATNFEAAIGFQFSQLRNWKSFVQLMCRPCDPASLAIFRIGFGLLMMIDTANERGFSTIKERISENKCFYPLFDFIQPMDADWLSIFFLIMFLGTIGITFGLFYRLSCLAFIIPYWYRHLLVTESWNNHSYLFGLIGTLFVVLDGHHCWSFDMLYRRQLKNAHVPLWNYAILRIQIFVVYFIAGIKKTDPDWLCGYSMHNLSQHWVFDPLKLLLNESFVDHVIVHIFGFLLDFAVGFFLYFDYTRPLAMFFCTCFHIMNSQLFSIGMFPYTMLATTPIFCYPNWPRKISSNISNMIKLLTHKWDSKRELNYSSNLLLSRKNDTLQVHDHCLYERTKTTNKKMVTRTTPRKYHHSVCIYLLAYSAVQGFLPFSHFITKGYNHWRDGLYGYSWDMMVHSQQLLHKRVFIHFLDNDTYALTDEHTNLSMRNRWTQYGRLTIQMCKCLENRIKLKDTAVKNIEIYVDVWTAINERIIQRFFDPRVNILTAEWSPFKPTPWVLPMINDSEVWRKRAEEMTEQYQASVGVLATFMSDFPGLTLENCVQSELMNATVEVLEGESILEIKGKANVTLKTGDTGNLTTGQTFKLHVISSTAATYFFVAVNKTVNDIYEKKLKVIPPALSESELMSREKCREIGMEFDFAFEGDVLREKEEYEYLSSNQTFLQLMYQIVQKHINAAIFNFNETKQAILNFAAKVM